MEQEGKMPREQPLAYEKMLTCGTKSAHPSLKSEKNILKFSYIVFVRLCSGDAEIVQQM